VPLGFEAKGISVVFTRSKTVRISNHLTTIRIVVAVFFAAMFANLVFALPVYQTKYRYDPLDRISSVQFGRHAKVDYQRDPLGRPIKTVRPGVETVCEYDQAGRLLAIVHRKSDGHRETVASRRYSYNGVGNCLAMVDEDNRATNYEYNGADWLTTVRYPDGERVVYAYNGAGDRLSETVGSRTCILYSFDPGGRMVARASDTFDWDADGNQVHSLENGNETSFTWSVDNRLIRVDKSVDCPVHHHGHCRCAKRETITESYGYLPEDWRRITRTITWNGAGHGHGHGTGHDCGAIPGIGRGHDGCGAPTTFVSVYDGQDESNEYLVKTPGRDECWKRDGNCRCRPHCPPKPPRLEPVREFLGGPGMDDIEATRYHGRTVWHAKDMLGSTIALTNNGGNAVSRVGYDAWGNFRWSAKGHRQGDRCGRDDDDDRDDHNGRYCDDRDSDDLIGLLDRLEGSRGFGGPSHDQWAFGRHEGKALTPYLYAGRRYQPVSGEYFNRNRYYAPKSGRFVSRDPIGFGGGDNQWTYTTSNPVSKSDPTGLYEFSLIVDDANWTLRASADGLINGWGAWWPGASARRYDGTKYSSAEALFQEIYSETRWSGRIRRLLFLGHGNSTGIQINSNANFGLNAAKCSTIYQSLWGTTPTCLNTDSMFESGALVVFLGCSVGSGPMPQAFADAFLTRPSYVGALTMDLPWYVGWIHSTRILSSPNFRRFDPPR